MKRKAITFTVLTIIVLILASAPFNIRIVKAESTDYTIEQVNHTIEIMYNGYIFINDTIQITGQATEGFLIGFPYKYGSHIRRCIAYNATNFFLVSLNVPLENHIGFYGVKISFPERTPQVFNVGFVLSNNLLMQNPSNMSQYALDFPAYPSLTKDVVNCSVSILLPEDSEYIGGTVGDFTYLQENLPAFTYSPASVAFSSTGNATQIFDVTELKREAKINGIGEIEGSDTYYITNKAYKEMTSIEVVLPSNASNPSAYDQFGRRMTQPVPADKANHYRITFTLPVEINKSNEFTIKYYLPREIYITQESSDNFILTFPLFRNVDYFIEQSSITYVPPEGAKVLSFENVSVSSSYSVKKGVFQETLTMQSQDVFWLDTFTVEIIYEYDLLWLSFRPVLWIWALATLGCTMVYIWKRPKALIPVTVSTVAMKLRAEHIESFVDAYERKRKILLEIRSLETKARKRKIPRRRYKVRRRTLETRLNTLSRSLAELKEKMRAAGGRYANLMGQLEVAETDINEIGANIESIEARHRRGELSLEAYRKLLADYERRKEKAETVVDGILIRLREEIH